MLTCLCTCHHVLLILRSVSAKLPAALTKPLQISTHRDEWQWRSMKLQRSSRSRARRRASPSPPSLLTRYASSLGAKELLCFVDRLQHLKTCAAARSDPPSRCLFVLKAPSLSRSCKLLIDLKLSLLLCGTCEFHDAHFSIRIVCKSDQRSMLHSYLRQSFFAR